MKLDGDDTSTAGKDTTFDMPMLFHKDTDEPTHGFKLVGSNSDRYQDKEREQQLKAFQKGARRGRGIDASTLTGAQELQNVIKRNDRELVEACIVEQYGWTTGGTLAPLDKDFFDAIFTRYPTWIAKLLGEIRAERDFTVP